MNGNDTQKRTLILASASPRRLEILKKHGITPLVRPSESDEILPACADQMSIDEKVVYLAAQKGQAVHAAMKASGALTAMTPPPVILAADTVVYKDGIIGKPADEADAVAILTRLCDTVHAVYSGVSILETETGAVTNLWDVTRVYFKDYSEEEILRYIRQEQPFDKSGSYAIKSSWSRNVARTEGDIENVMGLPWYRIAPLMANFGIV